MVVFADYITNMDAFNGNKIIDTRNIKKKQLNILIKNDNYTIKPKDNNIVPLALTAAIVGGIILILKN
jgi:hypothetical protein